MGNKYLETKNDTLESSILDVWKDAAKLDAYARAAAKAAGKDLNGGAPSTAHLSVSSNSTRRRR